MVIPFSEVAEKSCRKKEKFNKNAVVIQRFFRGYIARKKFKKVLLEKLIKENDEMYTAEKEIVE